MSISNYGLGNEPSNSVNTLTAGDLILMSTVTTNDFKNPNTFTSVSGATIIDSSDNIDISGANVGEFVADPNTYFISTIVTNGTSSPVFWATAAVAIKPLRQVAAPAEFCYLPNNASLSIKLLCAGSFV